MLGLFGHKLEMIQFLSSLDKEFKIVKSPSLECIVFTHSLTAIPRIVFKPGLCIPLLICVVWAGGRSIVNNG